MALVSIGNFLLPPEPLLFESESFEFRGGRAYRLSLDATLEIPNNVFSFLRVRPILVDNNAEFIYYHRFFDMDFSSTPRTLLIPMSNLYSDFSELKLEVERISFFPQSADEGDIQLEIFRDTNTVRTWLS